MNITILIFKCKQRQKFNITLMNKQSMSGKINEEEQPLTPNKKYQQLVQGNLKKENSFYQQLVYQDIAITLLVSIYCCWYLFPNQNPQKKKIVLLTIGLLIGITPKLIKSLFQIKYLDFPEFFSFMKQDSNVRSVFICSIYPLCFSSTDQIEYWFLLNLTIDQLIFYIWFGLEFLYFRSEVRDLLQKRHKIQLSNKQTKMVIVHTIVLLQSIKFIFWNSLYNSDSVIYLFFVGSIVGFLVAFWDKEKKDAIMFLHQWLEISQCLMLSAVLLLDSVPNIYLWILLAQNILILCLKVHCFEHLKFQKWKRFRNKLTVVKYSTNHITPVQFSLDKQVSKNSQQKFNLLIKQSNSHEDQICTKCTKQKANLILIFCEHCCFCENCCIKEIKKNHFLTHGWFIFCPICKQLNAGVYELKLSDCDFEKMKKNSIRDRERNVLGKFLKIYTLEDLRTKSDLS